MPSPATWVTTLLFGEMRHENHRSRSAGLQPELDWLYRRAGAEHRFDPGQSKGRDYDYCKSEFLHVLSVLHQLSGGSAAGLLAA